MTKKTEINGELLESRVRETMLSLKVLIATFEAFNPSQKSKANDTYNKILQVVDVKELEQLLNYNALEFVIKAHKAHLVPLELFVGEKPSYELPHLDEMVEIIAKNGV